MKWTPGSWHGEHRFPNVYCLKFPDAQSAIELGHGLYNRNSIYLTEVLYSDKAGAFIVASTIPAGRGAAEEMKRLLSVERQAEAAYGTTYNISEMEGPFGQSIGMRIHNVAPQAGNTPFPLVRPLIRSPRAPIESLSVHRLFVHGSNRFEVATFQVAPTAPSDTTEAEMTRRLTTLADEIVVSMQSCTASMPPRTQR